MPLSTLLLRLRALLRRSQVDSDLAEEMRLHLELREAQLRGDGLSADESRAAARRRFGSPLRLREESIDSWGWRWLEQLRQDLRFALRTLAAGPGFAATVVVTLALGIGANTAIFSVLNGVVLKPLPYASGDRLVVVRQSAPGSDVADAGVSVREYYDYREQATSFDALVEYHQMFFDLLRRGDPDRVDVGVVAHNFFSVLGIEPLLGRDFIATDDQRGADAVLMLSHAYWMARFGGDPSIVGQVFQMNDRPHTVIGVLPDVPHYPQENDVYMPVASCPFRAAAEPASRRNRRAFQLLNVFGRLKPGVTREAAAREIDAICGRFTAAHRPVYASLRGFTATAPSVQSELARDAEPLLLTLLGVSGLVLVIACANVANLALARLLRRDRELGLREALGAGRGRLVRQLLTESTLLSLLGAAVGLVFAASTMSLLARFIGRFTSRADEVAIDGWVLAFTTIVAAVAGVAWGTVPALMSRFDLGAIARGGLQASGRRRQRLQSALVIAQVAVSVVLLAGAGLLLTSFYRLQKVELGFDAQQVLAAETVVTFSRYAHPEPDVVRTRVLQLYQTILDRLEQEPGIVSAGISSAMPLAGSPPNMTRLVVEGMPTPDVPLTTAAATASVNYLPTLGVPIVEGRNFTTEDRADTAPAAIVSATLARSWPRTPVLGSRFTPNGAMWFTVVGIAGDVRPSLAQGPEPLVYVPITQGPGFDARIVVRSTMDPAATAATLKRIVHAVDPDLPVENIATVDDLRADQLSRPQLTAILLSVFAALALAVTMTGIAGVLAIHVAHRRTEFGVRMALGATPNQVVRPVLRSGLRLVTAGIVIGLGSAALLTRVLSSYLFETTPTDPVAFAVVALALLAAGGAACAGPAWRATRVDPQVVFRTD